MKPYDRGANKMREAFAESVVAFALSVDPNLSTEFLCDIFIHTLTAGIAEAEAAQPKVFEW